MYEAKVIADSIAQGIRLTTLQVTMPRFILAEFNTHRSFARNSASSRAIPVERRLEQVMQNPFIPMEFGKNQKGMQAEEIVDSAAQQQARAIWLELREHCMTAAKDLVAIGVHKQHANRVLELFVWHTVVVTATDYTNFFAQRCHPAAQPEMQRTAYAMREAMAASIPTRLTAGQWHLPYVDQQGPYVDQQGLDLEHCIQASVVRCAAVSYERQLAERSADELQDRFNMLKNMGHWSPFEHQAKVSDSTASGYLGNFRLPWLQLRKSFPNEAVFDGGST